jgi:hypothetical protein
MGDWRLYAVLTTLSHASASLRRRALPVPPHLPSPAPLSHAPSDLGTNRKKAQPSGNNNNSNNNNNHHRENPLLFYSASFVFVFLFFSFLFALQRGVVWADGTEAADRQTDRQAGRQRLLFFLSFFLSFPVVLCRCWVAGLGNWGRGRRASAVEREREREKG